MKMIINIITAIIAFFICILFAGYFLQRLVIFFPERLPSDYKFSFQNDFEETFYETNSNVAINALHFKTDQPKGIILYFHGNAGSLKEWGGVASEFVPLGYDALIIDYRGFGKSTGKITEEGMYYDAQFIYNELKKSYDESKIIVFGRSIGTGVASYIAAYNNPAKVILESPYVSIPDLAKKYHPWFPHKLIRFHFPNNLHLKAVNCPVFIIHGSNDEIIPVESSYKLGELLKEGDRVFIIKNGHHNDLSMFDEYQNSLIEILK